MFGMTYLISCLLSLAASPAAPSKIAEAHTLPAQAIVAPASPLVLRWSVGLKGGTPHMTIEAGGPHFTRTGATEHFAQLGSDLDPQVTQAIEEAAPVGPHLEMIVTQAAGSSIASFAIVGGAAGSVPIRSESDDRICFWSPYDDPTPAGVAQRLPVIGEWLNDQGQRSLTIRCCTIPATVGIPWHLGKVTTHLGSSLTTTRYFVKLGS